MPKSRLLTLASACLAALAALLLAAAGAGAQQTVGWIPTVTPFEHTCSSVNSFDAIQASVGDRSISYAAPGPGVITSWSTNAWEGEGQQLTFKVFRETEPLEYTVIAEDRRNLAPSAIDTFPVSIPVRRGDLIGLHDTDAGEHPSACLIHTAEFADEIVSNLGDAAVGETVELFQEEERRRLNLSATFLGVPTITSLGTTSGPSAGGTTVVIAGNEFADVQKVAFGSTPAAYTVDSEHQITATAPAGGGSAVHIVVTTLAGTDISPQTFSYVEPPADKTGSPTTVGPPAPTQAPAPPPLAIAKPKPPELTVGEGETVKVAVTNTGGTGTGPGSLRVKVPRGISVKPERQRLPAVDPGKSWTVSVRVEPTRQAKKKSTLSLTAAASGVTGTGSLVVKLKR